MSVQNI